MDHWAKRIEEFAKLPYKNISVYIQNTTPEEIEAVLDAIAKDAGWACKEVKTEYGNKFISYQEKEFREVNKRILFYLVLDSLQCQIEYEFIINGDTVQLDIESHYLTMGNGLSFILYFFFYEPFAFPRLLVISEKNSDNIQHMLGCLQMYFKDRVIVIENTPPENRQEANRGKISKMYVFFGTC